MKAVKLFVTLCLFCPVAVSQERQRPSQYVLAPKDNTLITVAAQYQCPLRIEEVQLLLNIDVSWDFLFRYQVRNTGTKAIKSYRIAFLTSQATGGTINDRRLGGRELGPGQTLSLEPFTSENPIVPLTEILAKKMKLGPPMKMVVVILVEKVEFSDGTIFSDESASVALRRYFQDLSGAQ